MTLLRPKDRLSKPHEIVLRLVALAVAANALLILWSSLIIGIIDRDAVRTGGASVNLHIIAALTLLYLSQLLARRKRAAWAIAVPIYAFILGVNSAQMLAGLDHHHVSGAFLLRDVLVPLLVVTCLVLYRDEFTVKSDIRNFAFSLRFVAVALVVTFLYGVVGFLLLDKRDFHQEISVWEAAHRTIDQFNFTTSGLLVPYTNRARLFLDSLATVSLAALTYSIVSFFQPLRARYSDQSAGRALMKKLLEDSPANSEEFFKLWPEDKVYLFDRFQSAGIAYRVEQGIALSCGAPVGDNAAIPSAMQEFEDECRTNDWMPAYIHVTDELSELYKKRGYGVQKIGEEAIINIEQFQSNVRGNKYFRHIANKFKKQDFSVEILEPPHNTAMIARLKDISLDWAKQPGRAERGFLMGYFEEAYLQQSVLVVARDAAGTIQAFLNLIPSFDPEEANYDMLRHTAASPGNINDFVLLCLLDDLALRGVKRFNLGLCPLAGLDDTDNERSIVDTALRFIYANGDRFYSFSGLHKFKAKYEPNWKDRYIVYRGGIAGFTRTVSALNKAVQVPKSKRNIG
jgi:phosphatidylglycerol lysyltransferase